jgi:hypothetical protein
MADCSIVEFSGNVSSRMRWIEIAVLQISRVGFRRVVLLTLCCMRSRVEGKIWQRLSAREVESATSLTIDKAPVIATVSSARHLKAPLRLAGALCGYLAGSGTRTAGRSQGTFTLLLQACRETILTRDPLADVPIYLAIHLHSGGANSRLLAAWPPHTSELGCQHHIEMLKLAWWCGSMKISRSTAYAA